VGEVTTWWRLWGGHVALAVTLLSLAGVVVAFAVALTTFDVYTVFYASLIGIGFFFMALCSFAYMYGFLMNRGGRYYTRQEEVRLTGLEPPGRPEKHPGSKYPVSRRSAVSEAHRRGEEKFRGR
jgi:hypothetical protein